MSLYLRGETWWYYLCHNGQRIRASTGTTDKRAAQRIHDEAKAALWATPSRSGLTWQDACVRWLTAAPRSESDRYTLAALDYPDRALTDCTAESFERALTGLSAATFNRKRAIIVAIIRGAGMDPPKIPVRKVKGQRLRFLTHDEWQCLYSALPSHLKPLAAFSIATGLRQRNATFLRWDQIDLGRKVMWIHPDEAKAGKPIGLPLADDAVAILRGQIGKSAEWVFPYEGRGRAAGQPITKIKTAWQLAMERAGLGRFERITDTGGKTISKRWIGDFTWHGLRHTWASWHIMSGTPMEVLQKLGGWNDLRMVARYAHLAPEYLAGFANNAKPWKREAAA